MDRSVVRLRGRPHLPSVPASLDGAFHRRLAGSRLGATFTLSVVLSLAVGADVPAAAEAPAAAPRASASPDEATTLGQADRRSAAAKVRLPRPARGAHAVRLLGDQLDEAAARNDLTEGELTELLTTDPSAWIDTRGVVFYKDEVASAPAQDPVAAQAPLDQTFLLHSKPGVDEDDLPRLRRRHRERHVVARAYPATPTTQPAWDLDSAPRPSATPSGPRSRTSGSRWPRTTRPSTSTSPRQDPGRAASPGRRRRPRLRHPRPHHPERRRPRRDLPGGCGGVAYLGVFDASTATTEPRRRLRLLQPAWVFPHSSPTPRRTSPRRPPTRSATTSA